MCNSYQNLFFCRHCLLFFRLGDGTHDVSEFCNDDIMVTDEIMMLNILVGLTITKERRDKRMDE